MMFREPGSRVKSSLMPPLGARGGLRMTSHVKGSGASDSDG
jgi:hypothetical protein